MKLLVVCCTVRAARSWIARHAGTLDASRASFVEPHSPNTALHAVCLERAPCRVLLTRGWHKDRSAQDLVELLRSRSVDFEYESEHNNR